MNAHSDHERVELAQDVRATKVYLHAILAYHGVAVATVAVDVRAGRWPHKPSYPTQRCAGRTLVIVGFGRIGQSVARKAAGFAWRLLVWDAYVDKIEMRRGGVEPADFETQLSLSGLVTLLLPLTEETRGMIDSVALAQMKPTVILVNTARGSIVDSAALLQAVESGQIAGAALWTWSIKSRRQRTTLFAARTVFG